VGDRAARARDGRGVAGFTAVIRIGSMLEGDVPSAVALEAPSSVHEDELRAELLRPWARLWVAREDDDAEAVAFLSTWHVADEIHVLNLVTRPDRRRRGIARALLREAIAYARRTAALRVLLEVRRSNAPAIGLYRSLGFFAFGVRARYYRDYEDALEMKLVFGPTGEIERSPDEVSAAP
jgi:ribosomal-protein-alanine N-acetyltransferase